jgi:hypothetical protein
MTVDQRIADLEREIRDLKANRLRTLTSNEIETLRGYLFEREASATLPSGAVVRRHLIMNVNGYRYAIPGYDRFTPLA